MKTMLKILLAIVLVVLLAAGALLAWLSATEYRPDPIEEAEVLRSGSGDPVRSGEELSLLCWNIGYGGLGKDSDFFLDGGKDAKPADANVVAAYLSGIANTIASVGPDIVFLQEVDSDSSRTYGIDERPFLDQGMTCRTYALNYSCPFVPVPVPPMGKVHSGLYTMTNGLAVDRAERVSLPCPFSWPLRTANLKRCLLVSYLPVEGSDRQLVLVNLHLEAYDDGEGKLAQTRQLREFVLGEYAKGNYVVAGGDFNQVFPGSLALYPNTHPENWEPGVLDEELLPDGWTLAYDLTTPTCRLLNQPYDPDDAANTQYYVIDGLILSPNIRLDTAETLDLGFADSDHNPVKIKFRLVDPAE